MAKSPVKKPTTQKPATAAKPISQHKQMAGYACGGSVKKK